MARALLTMAAAAARWLPAPLKGALYRLGPVSRGLRAALNKYAPVGLSQITVAGGYLAGATLLLDLQTEKDYWLGTYETNLQQAIQDWAQPGMVAYDVGANIGYISLLLSKRIGATGRALAFEPLPGNLERLQKNLELNPKANVQVIPKAVGDKSGVATFLIHDSSGMGRLEDSASRGAGDEQKIKVETVSLDDFVYSQKHPRPEIIKIDIEGGEASTLKGMNRMLTEAKPILLIELHGYEATRVSWTILNEARYSFYTMHKGYPKVLTPNGLGKKSYIVARPD